MTINDRIRILRKDKLDMTMDEFGKAIGVTRAAISNVENGARSVTDQLCKSICREFHVNESWLRDGEGEMFVQRTRNQIIADYLNEVMEDDGSSFRARFIEALSRLDMDDWLVIEKLVDAIATKKEES